jgi:predicted phosphodiesterase
VKSLVVSDLHSNPEALTAVFRHVQRKKLNQIICLGDFVGYGAQPNQVLDMMRNVRRRKLYVRGNHDRVAAGIDDGSTFNETARVAALWNRDHLSPPNKTFVRALRAGPLVEDGILYCHGSPHDEDEYIFTENQAARVLMKCDAPIILYGHTHLPALYSIDETSRVRGGWIRGEGIVKLEPGLRYMINPGSVGQPRDRNPSASFAIFDSTRRTVQFLRVEYEIEKTRNAILKAGLPRILADRLLHGT